MTSLKSWDASWQVVAGAYRAVGLVPHLDLEALPSGRAYEAGEVALDCDDLSQPGMGLHDLAHLLVAPPERKLAPNFGLGPHPQAYEENPPDQQIPDEETNLEESAAAAVNVHLAYRLFGAAAAREVAAEMSFAKYPIRPTREERALLKARGVYSPRGRLILPAGLTAYIDSKPGRNL